MAYNYHQTTGQYHMPSNSFDIRIGTDAEPEDAPQDEQRPLEVLIAGDFTGRDTGRSASVDIDNFEEVLSSFEVDFTLAPHTIAFREIDDFHPDRLLRHPLFDAADAAVQTPAPGAEEPSTGLLAQMLASPEPVRRSSRQDWLGEVLDPALRGITEEQQSPEQKHEAQRRVATRADLLRAILHHPGFQEREAAWRGLEFLLRAVDPSGPWRFRILDSAAIPRELPARCDIATLLYWFGESEQDLEVITQLATLARARNATVVGGASPQLLDPTAPAPWGALRANPAARHVGLALPRFLLRLPYGSKTEPVNLEGFEEQSLPPTHDKYLWGHPAWICTALMLARGRAREISGLPLHSWRQAGETKTTPCAEAVCPEKVYERMMDGGLMPLIAPRDQDRILVPRLQSIGSTPSMLAGRWLETE